MPYSIRALIDADRARWQTLWDDYNRFYGREPNEAVSLRTWANLHDAHSSVHGIAAIDEAGRVVGIAHYIIHESTSTPTPVCYLQDLYVDPDLRAGGIGKQMIDWLIAEMGRQGWSRLYWQTKENNYRARGLYDKYTPHSGFVRYVVANSAC